MKLEQKPVEPQVITALTSRIKQLEREHEARIVELKQSGQNLNKLQDELQKVKFEASEANAKIKTLLDTISIMSEAVRKERSPNNIPAYSIACYPPWQRPGYYK